MAIGSNLILTDKKLRIEAKKPFFVLEEGLKTLAGENVPFEPPENGSTEAQKWDSGAQSPRWQGRQDSNLQPSVLETDALPIAPRPYSYHLIVRYNNRLNQENFPRRAWEVLFIQT